MTDPLAVAAAQVARERITHEWRERLLAKAREIDERYKGRTMTKFLASAAHREYLEYCEKASALYGPMLAKLPPAPMFLTEDQINGPLT